MVHRVESGWSKIIGWVNTSNGRLIYWGVISGHYWPPPPLLSQPPSMKHMHTYRIDFASWLVAEAAGISQSCTHSTHTS